MNPVILVIIYLNVTAYRISKDFSNNTMSRFSAKIIGLAIIFAVEICYIDYITFVWAEPDSFFDTVVLSMIAIHVFIEIFFRKEIKEVGKDYFRFYYPVFYFLLICLMIAGPMYLLLKY